MSIETDFRALLTGSSTVTALVPAERIALHAAADDAPLPIIVYEVRVENVPTLMDDATAQRATITVTAWGRSGAEAAAVGDAIIDAVGTTAAITDVQTLYDERAGLDGRRISIDWWD